MIHGESMLLLTAAAAAEMLQFGAWLLLCSQTGGNPPCISMVMLLSTWHTDT
jgi:hypothetical protein